MNKVTDMNTNENEEEGTIKLRYLDIDQKLAMDTMLSDAYGNKTEYKRHWVEKLGIIIQEGESPSNAWLRAMSEENGFEFTLPVDRRLSSAIRNFPTCYRFYFCLLD
jgi:hypothetical protein